MEPRIVWKDGRMLGNAAAAAALCVDPDTGEPIQSTSFQWYIRTGKPAGNPAPEHVYVDGDFHPPQRMYDLDEVKAWQERRKGRGNWGGIGARARRKVIGSGPCPTCGAPTNVNETGVWVNHPHPEVETVLCASSGAPAASYTALEQPEPVAETVASD
jgi:hypothetical protein